MRSGGHFGTVPAAVKALDLRSVLDKLQTEIQYFAGTAETLIQRDQGGICSAKDLLDLFI